MPKPDASDINELLTKRAELFTQIRSFFSCRQVLEIEAPLISPAAVTDLHIESIPAFVQKQGFLHEQYLITSPEFFMKQLLCHDGPDIFYLGKVFRQDEQSRKHHHEFTMLEWYRRDWCEHQLMDEVAELLRTFTPELPVRKISYRDIFLEQMAINPHTCADEQLLTCVKSRVDVHHPEILSRNDCLELLFVYCLEPTLKGIALVHDYPKTQAALSQIGCNEYGESIARRFEVFWDGLELGNGYLELRDAQEQRARFEHDLVARGQLGRKLYPYDEKFLKALQRGLPSCAGVAMGIDRLLMKLLHADSLSAVVPALALH